MTGFPKKTNGWWYALALVVMIVGPVGSCATVLYSASSRVSAMSRVDMPGEQQVDLTPSDEVVYLENGGGAEGKAYIGRPASGVISCRMTNTVTGKPVPLRTPSSSVRFQFGGRSGRNLFDMSVPAAGTYVVACQHEDPKRTDSFVIAFGGDIGTALTLALALGFCLAILGLVMLIVVYRKRSRWDRAHARPPTAGTPVAVLPPGA